MSVPGASGSLTRHRPGVFRAWRRSSVNCVVVSFRHPHAFACPAACLFFIYQDAPFDIHYIDAEGREIPPEQALKAK